MSSQTVLSDTVMPHGSQSNSMITTVDCKTPSVVTVRLLRSRVIIHDAVQHQTAGHRGPPGRPDNTITYIHDCYIKSELTRTLAVASSSGRLSGSAHRRPAHQGRCASPPRRLMAHPPPRARADRKLRRSRAGSPAGRGAFRRAATQGECAQGGRGWSGTKPAGRRGGGRAALGVCAHLQDGQ